MSRVPFPALSAQTSACAIADVNLDGAADIAIIDFGTTNPIHLYLNDGYGGFTDVSTTHLPVAPATRGWKIEFARIDRDPWPDLVCGMGGQELLYLNDRTGKFKDVTATNLPVDTASSYGLAVGDVDADGDNDIVLGNTGGTHRLYLNDGLGVFSDASSTKLKSAPSNGAWDATLADVDGDKDLDLLFANSSLKQQELFIQDSSGVFQNETASRMPVLAWSARRVVAADVDGDGDLDLFYGNYNQQSGLLINDGKGNFKDETSTRLPALVLGTYGAMAMDVDEDRDADIICANYSGPTSTQPITLFLNDGKGTFANATATRFPNVNVSTVYVSGGDLDFDGDKDLVFMTYGTSPNGIYFNHQGQLYAEKAPAIGQNWAFDAYAQPGFATLPQSGVVFLGVGPLVPRVFTPWGRLGISPPLFVLGGFAIVPPGGKFTFNLPIPNEVGLRGIQLWWQGLHNHVPIDVRLMNVWKDTIQ